MICCAPLRRPRSAAARRDLIPHGRAARAGSRDPAGSYLRPERMASARAGVSAVAGCSLYCFFSGACALAAVISATRQNLPLATLYD